MKALKENPFPQPFQDLDAFSDHLFLLSNLPLRLLLVFSWLDILVLFIDLQEFFKYSSYQFFARYIFCDYFLLCDLSIYF